MFELNQIVIPRVMVHWEDLAYTVSDIALEMFKHSIKMAGMSMNAVKSFLPTGLPLLMVLHPKVIKHYNGDMITLHYTLYFYCSSIGRVNNIHTLYYATMH